MLVGITNSSMGIGDKLQFGSVPENWYRTHGTMLLDMDKCWVFDHNPYVVREGTPEKVINLWTMTLSQEPFLSQQVRFNKTLELKTFVRHPRLYQYEDEKTVRGTVMVHTNGISRGGIMQDQVIDQIAKTYKDFEIYQVGGQNDRDTPFNKALIGLGLWESAKVISQTEIFIGVNSSMMNIACCYPKIRRKLLINNENLNTYYPVSTEDHWIDYNWEYFNPTEDDIGITYSYRKI